MVASRGFVAFLRKPATASGICTLSNANSRKSATCGPSRARSTRPSGFALRKAGPAAGRSQAHTRAHRGAAVRAGRTAGLASVAAEAGDSAGGSGSCSARCLGADDMG